MKSHKSSDFRLKTPDEIKRIRESGLVISELFKMLSTFDIDGLSTLEIDKYIESFIVSKKSKPSFKLVNDYYHASCISVNDEIIHGIPKKDKVIAKGDLVKIDVGVVKRGYFADACRTIYSGKLDQATMTLFKTGREALNIGIKNSLPGNRLGTLGWAIEKYVNNNGFSIVRQFTGHGVGFAVHESPVVFHYGEKATGIKMIPGLVIAIEPSVCVGSADVKRADDGWTVLTASGEKSVQFEDTVAITENGPFVLTS